MEKLTNERWFELKRMYGKRAYEMVLINSAFIKNEDANSNNQIDTMLNPDAYSGVKLTIKPSAELPFNYNDYLNGAVVEYADKTWIKPTRIFLNNKNDIPIKSAQNNTLSINREAPLPFNRIRVVELPPLENHIVTSEVRIDRHEIVGDRLYVELSVQVQKKQEFSTQREVMDALLKGVILKTKDGCFIRLTDKFELKNPNSWESFSFVIENPANYSTYCLPIENTEQHLTNRQ